MWPKNQSSLRKDITISTIVFIPKRALYDFSKAAKDRSAQLSKSHTRILFFSWGRCLYQFWRRLCTGRYSFSHLARKLSCDLSHSEHLPVILVLLRIWQLRKSNTGPIENDEALKSRLWKLGVKGENLAVAQ